VYGLKGDNGVIYHVDFTHLLLDQCKGLDKPGAANSDYEYWVPGRRDQPASIGCQMGKKTTYVRRKTVSQCFNGMDFRRPNHEEICPCVMSDYSCAFGFYRTMDKPECVADPSGYSSPDCRAAHLVYVSPYRKTPGNVCEGGWKPSMTPTLCGPRSKLASSDKASFTILLLTIFLLSFVVVLGWNPSLRERFLGGVTQYMTLKPADNERLSNSLPPQKLTEWKTIGLTKPRCYNGDYK